MSDQLATDGPSEKWTAPEQSSPLTTDDPAPHASIDPSSTSTAIAVDTAIEPSAPDAAIGADVTPPVRTRRKRVSKWDRPPDPHDWRFFVGNLGKVLIATGLLMFGFVAYQLWGTGIETARAQSALKNEFQELIEQRQVTADEPLDVGRDEPAPVDTDSSIDEVTDDPPVATAGDTDTPVTAPADPAPEGGDSNANDVVTELPAPIEQDIPPIFRGDPLALLEIPAIGRSDIVVPGVSLNDLKDGPGHYPETPLPGQLGNAAIAGHRTTYGAPFFDVDDLVPGDEIKVTMLTGDQFVYEVTSLEIVSASDYWVVTTSDPTVAELTLTSCHPKYTARDRIVVHSVLNPAKSSNVGFPTAPYELEPDDEPIPGDDPVLVADPPDSDVSPDPVRTDPIDDSDDQPADDGDDSDPVSALPADPTTPVAGDTNVQVGDAFSQGWFDDRAAFSQIALWGIALSLISLAAYRISRRFRHDSIGFLVGIAPFLFALYFFFQNVNRLLPPGL